MNDLKQEFKEIRSRKARAFLRAFVMIGTIMGAAKTANCSPSSHYETWMKDEVYRAAFARALEMNTDSLEQVAIERARKSSDLLLIFLLKARKPDIYREQRMIMGDPNNAIQHEMRIIVERTDTGSRKTYLTTPKALSPGTDSK